MERYRASPGALLLVASALVLWAVPGFSLTLSTVTEITIPDGIVYPGAGGTAAHTGWFNNISGNGIADEDQEVEPGMVSTQPWDLEGMFFDDGTGFLTLVGGWDFQNGQPSGSYPASEWSQGDNALEQTRFDSGDIFIAVGPSPFFAHGSQSPTSNWRGFDYVLDVNWQDGTFNLYSLTTGSAVLPATEPQNTTDSDPWRYDITPVVPGVHGFTIETNPSFVDGSNNPATPFLGGGTRYAAQFDLIGLFGTTQWSFLANEHLWFHFTEECGNDALRGHRVDDSPGTSSMPEPATVALLGVALAGVGLRRKLTKK